MQLSVFPLMSIPFFDAEFYFEFCTLKAFVRKANLPVIESPCPEDKESERAYMKTYLGDFDHKHRGLYPRIIGALQSGEIDGWKE